MPSISWNTHAHLAEISRNVSPGAHAILVIDGAGWHTAGDRVIPGNITLMTLPPCGPELNPVENIRQFLRQDRLANRVFENCDAVVTACCDAWNALIALPEQIASIATRDRAKVNA